MMDRLMGVITLKAPTYRQIADDQTATSQAAMVVIIVSLIQGFFSGTIQVTTDGVVTTSIVGGVVGAFVGVCLGLLSWAVASWVLATVATALGGKTNTGEMLRVTGFVQIFGLVSILNALVLITPVLSCVSGLLGFVIGILALIGYIIGVREAAEFDTTKAIIAAIVAAVVNFVITVVVAGIVAGLVFSALAIAGAR